MEQVTKGKFVELAYKIFLVDSKGEDTLIYEFDENKPDRFVFGHELGMLEAFVNHLEGLKVGDSFDFILSPIEAFGEHDPSMVVELDKSLFVLEGEFDSDRVYEGAFVPMMTAEGERIEGIVKKITDTHVTLDFNHQLAGETVKYVGKIVNVREATDEEKNPPRQQCGGCSGCGDGGCDKEGCEKDGCDGNHDGNCCHQDDDCCKGHA